MKKKRAPDNIVLLEGKPGESASRIVARHLLDPSTTAAGTLNRIHRGVSAESDINGYIAELQAQRR